MKRFMLLVLALALVPALAVLFACGGSSPTTPSQNPSGAPPPPVVVCSPQYPATLTTGYTLPPGMGGAYETILTQKASIKVTFAWTPANAPAGVFVMSRSNPACVKGPCDGALASDYTTKPSPKVIQTEVLNPGSYFVVLDNLDAHGVFVGTDTMVEICE